MSKDYDYRAIEAEAQADWESAQAYKVVENAVGADGTPTSRILYHYLLSSWRYDSS